MKSLKKVHSGLVLLESLISLAISLVIISTLTLCISEQFKILHNWEERVNAHKLISLHLQNENIPDQITVKGQKYFFAKNQNSYQVRVNQNVYQIKE